MHFTKVHGLGNDFVLVDVTKKQDLPNDLASLAIKVCHRHFGIGADGLVLIKPGTRADLVMQIYNSDGSEAEMCGNAIRCVAKYAYEQNLVSKTTLAVETAAGIMVPELVLGEHGEVKAVKVDMGQPRLQREQIPMLGPSGQVISEQLTVGEQSFAVTMVSMGNPHCIIFVPDVDQIPLTTIGPLIENHDVFPRKTNVEFVQVLNKQEVKMRVWERGAGPTLACGTGACATVVAAVLNQYTNRLAKVHLAAGALEIHWADNNHVYMTGPAEQVFTGDYILPD